MTKKSRQKIPKYRGLRILIIPILLYYMLILPVLGMLYFTNYPKLVKEDVSSLVSTNQDSLLQTVKEIEHTVDSIKGLDSLVAQVEKAADSLQKKEAGINISISQTGNKGYWNEEESLFFNWLLLALALGILYSIPFKIFFRRKRKDRKIPAKIKQFCRKTILYSPAITGIIIAIPFVVLNASLINKLFISNNVSEPLRRDILIQYWQILMLASLLTIAFAYYWQKHNMQIKYLQHIFSAEELRKRIFKFKGGKIKHRLVFSSFLTTLLPLTIVVAYLFMSLTSLSDINLYEPAMSEFRVIFGEYSKLFTESDMSETVKDTNLVYINAIDAIVMFVGIGSGILVTIIYLFFFVGWTNSGIIKPVKELLHNMQKTTGGQLQNYSLVRTNDEIGELSENYNIMTVKLHEYVSHIDKMNAELELKVKARTAEIHAQKEEIAAQRDEVESQRDEIEQQRDYVIEQRDLIINQKKAITDSIEYAGNIQSAILPPLEHLKDILQEHFIFFLPRDIVSGDFYWAHKIKNGKSNKNIIVAADCTGHGVPGAFMSMLGITLLNGIVLKMGVTKPSEILDLLKENIVNSLHQTSEIGKPKDGIDLSICSIDYQKRELEYAGAYNPVYIIRKIEGNDELHKLRAQYKEPEFKIEEYDGKILVEIKADKNPIGISHKQKRKYTLKNFKLNIDDSLFMFSDGFADQFGGPKRLKFLYSRFKSSLLEIAHKDMDQQKSTIIKTYQNWKGNEKQIDDVLLIGIKIK